MKVLQSCFYICLISQRSDAQYRHVQTVSGLGPGCQSGYRSGDL